MTIAVRRRRRGCCHEARLSGADPRTLDEAVVHVAHLARQREVAARPRRRETPGEIGRRRIVAQEADGVADVSRDVRRR